LEQTIAIQIVWAMDMTPFMTFGAIGDIVPSSLKNKKSQKQEIEFT